FVSDGLMKLYGFVRSREFSQASLPAVIEHKNTVWKGSIYDMVEKWCS
ncbi:2303_t:CDS:1, partial [Scutellospora calospora]